MNYRHIFHAGNFADVFKHSILMLLTKYFLRKETAFCYLDTHAGIGRYHLLSEAAQKTKEYETGINKIFNAPEKPSIIIDYLKIIQSIQPSLLSCNNQQNIPFSNSETQDEPEPASILNNNLTFYPGSPEIVKFFLRKTDRMMLCEYHPEDYSLLKKNLGYHKQIAIHHQDGYQSLKALLPPKEKRGMILIDPPYENKQEFSQLLTVLPQALSRFETGVYAIWYPIKDRATIQQFHQALKNKITRKMLVCELTLYPNDLTTQLNGCGMVIINPPFQLDEQLKTLLPWLWKALSTNMQGEFVLKNLRA